jgi:uncharacterized membrane protein
MFIKSYLIALLVFLVIDFIWLGLIAKNFYQQQIGGLMKTNINWPAAIIFYLIFVVGLVVFVINPSLASGSWLKALILGALFGFIAYATYDLTNLATLKDWPLIVTVVDLIWGAVVAGSTSVIAYFIINYFS